MYIVTPPTHTELQSHKWIWFNNILDSTGSYSFSHAWYESLISILSCLSGIQPLLQYEKLVYFGFWIEYPRNWSPNIASVSVWPWYASIHDPSHTRRAQTWWRSPATGPVSRLSLFQSWGVCIKCRLMQRVLAPEQCVCEHIECVCQWVRSIMCLYNILHIPTLRAFPFSHTPST